MASNQPPVTTPAQPYGEIYDLGYKHYDGKRLGRTHAIQALIVYSIKRGLGIKKKWTAKLIPFALYMIAFVPAFIVAGIKAFIPTDDFTYTYHDLNDFIFLTLFIFAAALGPEMLSDDRRENVLGLYFSRAITRLDYLLAKIAAMGILLGTIAFGPPLLLFIANVLLADNPISYFFDHFGDLGRIAAYGILASAYLGAISLAIAAYTNRKGVAGAIFIGGVLMIAGIANALFEALDSGIGDYIILVDPFDLVAAISAWIWGEPTNMDIADLPGVWYGLAVLATVALSALIMYRRYLADE
jgi:ABC-2 type transport system permease protein